MSNKPWASRQKELRGLLRQMRKDAGLTQVELAARLSVPQSYVSKYESGERRLDVLEVQAICEACGVRLENFSKKISKLPK